MSESLNNSLDTLFGKMEDFISTKTIVGEAVTVGGVTLLPLIEVSVGVGAGVNDADKKESGVGGLGAKIVPSAVLVISNGNVQLINVKNQDAINKLIDMVPSAAAKLNFGSIFGQKENAKEQQTENQQPKEEVKFEEKLIIEDITKDL